MSHTITVRLPEDLAHWIEKSAAQSGVSQGQLVREYLERARGTDRKSQRFMRLAGTVRGARNLSQRKGFSKG